MKKLVVALATATALLGATTGASAQDRSSTRGLLLGLHLGAAAVQLDEEGAGGAENGGGLGLTLGYGFTDHFALLLRADGASINYEDDVEEGSYGLGNVDLGGRYSFGSAAAALRPYAELGVSATALVDEIEDEEITFSGGAVFLGGGLEYFFSRRVALDAGLVIGKGKLTTVEFGGTSTDDFEDLDFTTSRLNVGVSFRL